MIAVIGTIFANHIMKIDEDFVWEMVSIIRGSKDEKRSVIILQELKYCAGFETAMVSF